MTDSARADYQAPAPAEVVALADRLDHHANRYVHRDWEYTRDLGALRSMKYDDARDRLPARVRRSVRNLLPWRDNHSGLGFLGPHGLRERLIYALVALRRRHHLPGGQLRGAGVYVQHEEEGEYIQYVQPSVGGLLVPLLREHPDLPEVQAIAAEMLRIEAGYAHRINEGLVDGERRQPADA